MYVILVNKDNTLSAPLKERIVQRSKLVDTLWILSHPIYKGFDMTNATVLMEYIKPVSREYKTEVLQLSSELYEDHLKYTLPFDTELTNEAGDIEIQLSFIYVDIDVNGKPIQKVRKTAPAHKLTIVPIEAWSNIIPDSALSAIDQRIIKVDAQIKAMADMSQTISETKADNLKYDSETNELQLMAGKNSIGNVVQLKECKGIEEDGVPVVDFSNLSGTTEPDEYNNVVEF